MRWQDWDLMTLAGRLRTLLALIDVHYDGDLNPRRSGTVYDAYAFVPLAVLITHTSFDGDAFSTVATPTKIENTSWSSTIPADAKALNIEIATRDSAAWGTAGLMFAVGPSATYWYALGCRPAGGDVWVETMGAVPCTDGDIYYRCTASGTGTLDVYLRCWGYWL